MENLKAAPNLVIAISMTERARSTLAELLLKLK